jgi:hypothetical protein
VHQGRVGTAAAAASNAAGSSSSTVSTCVLPRPARCLYMLLQPPV